MEARLQQLWDHHEIRQLLAPLPWLRPGERGGDGTDLCRAELGRSRSEQVRRQGVRATDPGTGAAHHAGREPSARQSPVGIDGDKAAAETYFVATLISDEDQSERKTQLGGATSFPDSGERNVVIRERLCVRDWSSTGLIDPGYLARPGFIEGQRGPADVSWQRLGLLPL